MRSWRYRRRGRSTLFGSLGLGWGTDEPLLADDQLALGRLFSFSTYEPLELSGSKYGSARLGYYYRLGKTLLLGGYLEAAGVADRFSDVARDVIQTATALAIIDSQLGPRIWRGLCRRGATSGLHSLRLAVLTADNLTDVSGRSLRRVSALLVAGSTAAAALLADGRTDVLVLENDDRLTGEIKTLDRGELTFKTDALGTLSVDWARVRSIESGNTFDVEVEDGSRYLGSIEASGESRVLVVGDEKSTALSLAEIVRIRRIRSSFWNRLDGSLSLGLNFTSASSDLQLNLAADARIRRINVERSLSASWIETSRSDSEATTRSELRWTQLHLLRRRRLLFLSGKLQRNDELGIDARGLVMAGYGRRFVQTNRSRISGALGLAANLEDTVDGSGREVSTEGLVSIQYEFFRRVGLDRDITLDATLFPSLDGSSRYRLDVRGSVYFEIVKDFGMRLELADSYDSQPPVAIDTRNDLAAIISVVWTY